MTKIEAMRRVAEVAREVVHWLHGGGSQVPESRKWRALQSAIHALDAAPDVSVEEVARACVGVRAEHQLFPRVSDTGPVPPMDMEIARAAMRAMGVKDELSDTR